MIERQKYERLFATPLLRFTVDDKDALNADLLALGSRLRADSDGVEKSNRGGWHSEGNLFDVEDPATAKLRTIAENAVLNATETIGTVPDKHRMKLFAWMNANPPGGFNAPHTHPGAHWSGVYYVSQPEIDEGNSGMIEFLDPRSDLPEWRILKARSFRPKIKIRPQPGEIVLFPSYLVHWVYPNEADEERVSIAFNATFRKVKASDDD